jgi:hypothetical protein
VRVPPGGTHGGRVRHGVRAGTAGRACRLTPLSACLTLCGSVDGTQANKVRAAPCQ